jgi:hypothetical protein
MRSPECEILRDAMQHYTQMEHAACTVHAHGVVGHTRTLYPGVWRVRQYAVRWNEDPEVLMYRMVDLMMSGSVIHEIDEGPGSWDPGT